MKNYLKKKIKEIITSYGWKLSKIHKNKSYTNQKPNMELLKAINSSNGILHMGAHRGSEAAVYDWFNKKTIWIEANPKIYTDLKINISTFINQSAFNILLYEEDDKKISFNISNNDGASSSIYSFGPESEKDHLKMINSVNLISKKIDTFFIEQSFKAEEYDFWVMDIQGAELSALKGAIKSLEKCNFVYVEVSVGDYYKNASQWEEIKNFLKKFNFMNVWEPASSHTDILFKKIN
tara:strand:+ start:35 stop:742 length:708 start_codon:yes stop_codon:yes gene_type:complete